MVCAAVRRDFRFSSLTLGLSCAFSSICVCGPFIGVCSRGCPRAQGSTDCGGGAWGRPWWGLIRAHPRGGPSQCQERGASTGGERLQWGSSLWTSPHVPAPSPCLQWWTPSQAGWAGHGSVPHMQVSSVLLPQTVAMFSSHRE